MQSLVRILAGVALIGMIALAMAHMRALDRLEQAEASIASLKGTQAETLAAVQSEIAKLREAEAAAAKEREATVMSGIAAARAEAGRARREAQGVGSRVEQASADRAETLKSLENLAARLGSTENTVKASRDQTAKDLEELRRADAAAQTGIARAAKEIGVLRADTSDVRQRADQAQTTLRRVEGDLGALGGLVATNTKEIALLRQAGDRELTEFMIFKRDQPTRLGPISIQIKNTDIKAQKFHIDLWVDDRKVEKKDRFINEPLQFYVGRDLHELVVNRVEKDQITGYLAAPKH